MPATSESGQPIAHVRGLRVFPVKSMDAGPVSEAVVLSTGLEHDRGWVVLDASGAVLSARQAPALAQVRALPPTAPGAGPQLQLPGAELPVRDASADAALSTLLGQAVQVRPAADVAQREAAAVHVISDDDEQTRANVVLALDSTALDSTGVGSERDWVGRRLQVGEVLLGLTRTPRSCAGVYADVLQPGLVRVDDVVRLL